MAFLLIFMVFGMFFVSDRLFLIKNIFFICQKYSVNVIKK
jgi:hypothetical protein